MQTWREAQGPPLQQIKKPSVFTEGFFDAKLHQLDDGHLSGVAAAGTDLDDTGVTAVTVGILGGDLLEQLVGDIFLGDVAQSLAVEARVLSLPRVIIFSATGATSLARVRVVLI